jgi:CHASE2 domain-containing sensor protein
MKYWAFISYSHRDESWARWLHRAIEAYRVPGRLVGKPTRSGVVPKRIFPVFRDRDELPASSDLGGNILNALKQSRFLVVICSPEAATSRWVNEEVRTFKALGREDRVLCLVVDGEPNASDRSDSAPQECFPLAVRYRITSEGVLGQERSEPLAADARPGKDGRSDAKLKLVSGLLGVGLDELKLREKKRQRAGQWLSLMFAALFGAVLLVPRGPVPPLRSFVFDTYQVFMPRRIVSSPTTIVEIDHKSIAALGQWPWPRFLLARLVDVINAQQPAAIGISILMPDPDRLSPERLLARARQHDPELARRLDALPGHDAELARALADAPTVLSVFGTFEASGMPLRAPPFNVIDRSSGGASPTHAPPGLLHFANVQTSLDALDRAARGRGLVIAEDDGGVIRRIPLVASVDGRLAPALAIEMLRVAVGAPSLQLYTSGAVVEGIGMGDLVAPTEADGAVRVHFSVHKTDRFISAVDVLEGRFDSARLQRKLVLIGVTVLGLVDEKNTPLGASMSGVEIQAQLLENLLDGTLLTRPSWAPRVEASAFCLLAILIVLGAPGWSATRSFLALFACCTIVTIAGVFAFSWSRLLFDPAHVILGVVMLFGINMSYGFFSSSARLPDPGALES